MYRVLLNNKTIYYNLSSLANKDDDIIHHKGQYIKDIVYE